MSASKEALFAIRHVASHLGELREHVVFVGGIVRGLLVTDPAVEGSRPTKDVDVIAANITTRAEYYTQLTEQLRTLGFKEDTTEGAPMCRWKLGPITVDVMPSVGDVLNFSNRWYPHAVETATRVTLPAGDTSGPITIRLISASSFIATKLEAFADRGNGDYEVSHDLEDIIAIVDGRPSLVEEVEQEPDELRSYIAEELSRHFSGGLREALPGHLAGDSASQKRLPFVLCTLDRVRRQPTVLSLGAVVQSTSGGEPGGTDSVGPWRYELIGVEQRVESSARVHIVVRARLTNLSLIATTIGDGRAVHIEDAAGRRFPPLHKLINPERNARNLPSMFDQAVPDDPFETCWVYELPREAKELRLLLPFGGYELPLREGMMTPSYKTAPPEEERPGAGTGHRGIDPYASRGPGDPGFIDPYGTIDRPKRRS